MSQIKLCNVIILQIKTYALLNYHDEPINFVTRHYFQEKGEGSKKIRNIWLFMMALPSLLSLVFMLNADTCFHALVSTELLLGSIDAVQSNLPSEKDRKKHESVFHSENNKTAKKFQSKFKWTRDGLKYLMKVKEHWLYKKITDDNEKAYVPSVNIFYFLLLLGMAALHIATSVSLYNYSEVVFINGIATALAYLAFTILPEIFVVALPSVIVVLRPLCCSKWTENGHDNYDAIVEPEEHNGSILTLMQPTVNYGSLEKQNENVDRRSDSTRTTEEQSDDRNRDSISTTEEESDDNKNDSMLTAHLIRAATVYLISYFLPYMILAIIYFPFRAVFIYSMAITIGAWFYYSLLLICCLFYNCCKKCGCCKKENPSIDG